MTFYNNVTVHAGELFAQIEVCLIEIVEVLITAGCLIGRCTNWYDKRLLSIYEVQRAAVGAVSHEVCVCVCSIVFSSVVTLWAVAHQANLSMGFSSKNTGVGSNLRLVHCRWILYH